MRSVKTYERYEPEIETHEGAGTGLDLTVEDALAEALALVEPPEPYVELHRGPGTGMDLITDDVMAEVELILSAGEMIGTVDAYLESYWIGAAEAVDEAEMTDEADATDQADATNQGEEATGN